MKNCSFINKPIVIFRGDDTSAFNLRSIKIILKGDLDLSNAIAKFSLLDYHKEWTVHDVVHIVGHKGYAAWRTDRHIPPV